MAVVAVKPALLVWAREHRGLTVAEAADKLSIDEADLGALESGQKPLNLTMFKRISDRYLSLVKRQTDYEIADVTKRNPTEMTLSPVPMTVGYDPIPAFNWSFEQLENVARGEPVDEKVDENLLIRFARIVPKENQTGTTGLWITYGDKRVDLNIEFKQRAEALASLLKITERRPEWMVGKSVGSVTGELLQVDDFDERHQFAIQPPDRSG